MEGFHDRLVRSSFLPNQVILPILNLFILQLHYDRNFVSVDKHNDFLP